MRRIARRRKEYGSIKTSAYSPEPGVLIICAAGSVSGPPSRMLVYPVSRLDLQRRGVLARRIRLRIEADDFGAQRTAPQSVDREDVGVADVDLERGDGARRDLKPPFLRQFAAPIEDLHGKVPPDYVWITDPVDIHPHGLTNPDADWSEQHLVFGVLDRERAIAEQEQRRRKQRDNHYSVNPA
ncbi:MAG: hypothetical protein ACRD1S_17880 [Vicinamibacterales bacterium]